MQLVLSLLLFAAQAATPRQVVAPPSDVLDGTVRLPDPASVATVSRAAILPLRFRGGVAEVEWPVEEGPALSIALLSPDAGTWRIAVEPPGESMRPLEQGPGVERRLGPAGLELPGWAVDRYDLRDARAGRWHARIEAGSARAPSEGWLLASADRELRVEAFATTLELVGGEPIEIAARLRGREAATVEGARAVVESPTGNFELPMVDDGDGLFRALLPESVRGQVRARVELRGGTFLRSAVIAFPVLERRLFLDGTARARALPGGQVEISIGAIPVGPSARLHVSAEVWSGGPVCWLSRMLEPEPRDGLWALPLELDPRWLDAAGAEEPLELREVRVQDPDTEVVLDRAARVPLQVVSLLPRGGSTIGLSGQPPFGRRLEGTPTSGPGSLMLVHGYCSGGSIWPPADFTEPKTVFLDPSQNRTHDQFAQLIAQQAQSAGLATFGIVAHSQGGCAALHLLTYYQSGLDFAHGARRIQSVASPYQGTPLAQFGGLACGVNNDMTPAGSATWLSGIPNWARSQVHYWTTSNSGSACSSLTDFLLTNPEDGTVEQFRGQLPGAVSMGHVLGWCHTTGMSNPANYTDHARNTAMNSAAAR